MPLDTTNFHPQGPVKSLDLMQFYNLFTGVMTDQPVTFSNTLTLGGNQSVSTVPLRVYGAVGQNTDLIDLYADKSQSQPGFGFSAVGRFAWGPGGASPQDTFLSRIALQNGHSSDTPGLLITPTLEVTGNIKAAGYTFNNGGTVTGPGGNINQISITQDLVVQRYIFLNTGATNSARIRQTDVGNHQGITIESSDNAPMLMGASGVYLGHNTSWIAPNGWTAMNSANPGALVYMFATGSGMAYQIAAATAGVQNFVDRFRVDPNGNAFVGYGTTGNLTVYGNAVNVGSASVGGHLYLSEVHLSNWNANQLRIYGSVTTNGDVSIESDHSLVFGVNGYGWKGISGNAIVTTAGSVMAQAGALYLDGSLAVKFYWDGTWLHSTKPLYSDSHVWAQGNVTAANGGNVASQGGSYYAGASSQSQLGMWNPGEWRVGSSPGNFYTIGILQSDVYTRANGSGAQGNGAYVNTASSETVKTNIQPLAAEDCLDKVLDRRMGPVRFDYIKPRCQVHENVPSDLIVEGYEPRPVHWSPDYLGFIAEQVAQVVPEAVGVLDDGVAHGLTVEGLVPVLWGAVRALDARVKQLEGVAA